MIEQRRRWPRFTRNGPLLLNLCPTCPLLIDCASFGRESLDLDSTTVRLSSIAKWSELLKKLMHFWARGSEPWPSRVNSAGDAVAAAAAFTVGLLGHLTDEGLGRAGALLVRNLGSELDEEEEEAAQ